MKTNGRYSKLDWFEKSISIGRSGRMSVCVLYDIDAQAVADIIHPKDCAMIMSEGKISHLCI